MSDVNLSVFTGNLVRDCEVKSMNGLTVASFMIASNRAKMKKQEDGKSEYVNEAFYLRTQIFGKTAENLSPYLKKGIKVSLQGHWENAQWEKDGKKISKVQFYTESLQFLSKKQDNESPTEAEEKEVSSRITDENLQEFGDSFVIF